MSRLIREISFTNCFPKQDLFSNVCHWLCKRDKANIPNLDNYLWQNVTALKNHVKFIHSTADYFKSTLHLLNDDIHREAFQAYYKRDYSEIQNEDIQLWFIAHPWMNVKTNYWLKVYTLAKIQKTIASTKKKLYTISYF